jgi:surface antigen
MRLILTLALSTGLALLCRPQIGAAAKLPQPTQETAQTKCSNAMPEISPGSPAEQSTNPACPPEKLNWRLSRHGPGFWTADAAAPAPTDAAGTSRTAVLRTPLSQPPADPPGCPTYSLMVVISGEPREATVVACPQPDGSWQVTQYTPGLPTQTFAVPPPAAGAPPDESAGWDTGPAWDWAAAPWFFGYAPAVVVVQAFNRFHRFGHQFGHGFDHGFAHGDASGRGFAGGNHIAEGHGERQDFPARRSLAVGLRHGFSAAPGFAASRR